MLLCAAELKVNLFPFHSGSDLVSMQIVGSEVLGSTNKVFKHKAQFNSVRSGFERRKMRLEGFCMKVGDYTARPIIQKRGCNASPFLAAVQAGGSCCDLLDCVGWIAPPPPP